MRRVEVKIAHPHDKRRREGHAFISNMSLQSIILLSLRSVNARASLSRATCLLVCALMAACSAPQCRAAFDYEHRPEGYHWKGVKAPQSRNVVYYGVDPSDGSTVYVGPDGQYYRYRHRGVIEASDLHSQWCPHGVGFQPAMTSQIAAAFASVTAIFAHRDRLVTYDYLHRPAGYGWTARRSKGTGIIGYYGIDPANGWTVYVGPDGLYYTFPHRGEIVPRDLSSLWDPHKASELKK